MASSSLFDIRGAFIYWRAGLVYAKKLMLPISAVCTVAGGIGAIVGLSGGFDSVAHYCDARTKPCTQVSTPVWMGIPQKVESVQFEEGWGLRRVAGSGAAILLFGAGLAAAVKELESIEESEKEQQVDDQIAIARREIQLDEEVKTLAIAADLRVQDFKRELLDGMATLMLEENPDLAEEILRQARPEEKAEGRRQEAEVVTEKPAESKPEPEVEKIPPGIQLMLDSDLKDVVDAGILSLIGAQGSGKTTTSCMLLRYRIWKGHKLIIVNPHKKKTMYQGLESFLLHGTTFYGVGKGDLERAQSLLDGLERILKLIGDRYDEYQNLDEEEYSHFPVTILLEESAEYEGLLSVFNRPANPKEGEPGFSAKRYLTLFWKKFFIATRKGNCFGIRTLQFDSNTMNGTEGMAELIKSQGACTLTQFSVPDGNCIGGWRSTGEGELEIPNQKYFDKNGKPIDTKPVNVPTWFDYSKVFDPTDFKDLSPAIQSGRKKVNSLTEPQSHNSDISPDELLHQNIDRIVSSLNTVFDSSPSEYGSDLPNIHPELTPQSQVTEPQQKEVETQVQPVAPALPKYTPLKLTKEELIPVISKLRTEGLSQTKIIEQLWQVQKSRSGWKQAYKEAKEIGL